MAIEGVDPPTKDSKPEAERAAAPERPARRAAPGMRKLHEQVTDLYVTLGTMVVTPIDRLAGYLLVEQAEALAQTWIDLAETNPAVKRALSKLVEAGGWGGVLVAHGMVMMPVLANRGMFPDHIANGIAMGTILTQEDDEARARVQALFTHSRFNGNGSGPQA